MRRADENIHTVFTLTSLCMHPNIKQAAHKKQTGNTENDFFFKGCMLALSLCLTHTHTHACTHTHTHTHTHIHTHTHPRPTTDPAFTILIIPPPLGCSWQFCKTTPDYLWPEFLNMTPLSVPGGPAVWHLGMKSESNRIASLYEGVVSSGLPWQRQIQCRCERNVN